MRNGGNDGKRSAQCAVCCAQSLLRLPSFRHSEDGLRQAGTTKDDENPPFPVASAATLVTAASGSLQAASGKLLAAGLLAAALLVPTAARPASAQGGSRLWHAEERVVVSDFSRVQALAASQFLVFVATESGLGIYDRRFRSWAAPLTNIDGYPRGGVLSAIADPADESVWLATSRGLIHYEPTIRLLERVSIPGGVAGLMFDRDDPFRGLYVRTSSGWEFLPRGSNIPFPAGPLPPPGRRLRPVSVEDVLRRAPMVESMSALTLTDERMRTYRYTSAAIIPTTDEIFLGTDGLGVLKLETTIARFERLPFGLLTSGVGAIALTPGGVWAATDERSRRSGFTLVSDDLQSYMVEEGPRVTGFNFRSVRSLINDGGELWAATDAGVFRVEPGGASRQIDVGDGLPDNESYALAKGPGGVWVGTAFGLAFIDNEGAVVRVGGITTNPIIALSASGDSVWIGTTAGLAFATAGRDEILVPRHVVETPQLFNTAIIAIAQSSDTLVVASADRIFWRAPGGEWVIERVIADEIGAIRALAADDGGVWIGGNDGIAFFRFAFNEYRFYSSPGDLSGRVKDLAVSGDFLWVATDRGLMRFQRRALLP